MRLKAKSKIAELRKQTGLTQAELAVYIGVTTNTIQNWEKEDGLEQLEKFLKLCVLFKCSPTDLIEYVPDFDSEKPSKGYAIEKLHDLLKFRGNQPQQHDYHSNKPTPVNLSRWLERNFEREWQPANTLWKRGAVSPMRGVREYNYREYNYLREKLFRLMSSIGQIELILRTEYIPETQEVSLQVCTNQDSLPEKLVLIILDEKELPLIPPASSKLGHDSIKITLSVNFGDTFSLKVTLEESSIMETFTIDT